ncbi:MAG: hypothetical protein JWQ04_3088 [Pedosphaera sp.]|nr:hypothetical protein [Pedosphaera sp.]
MNQGKEPPLSPALSPLLRRGAREKTLSFGWFRGLIRESCVRGILSPGERGSVAAARGHYKLRSQSPLQHIFTKKGKLPLRILLTQCQHISRQLQLIYETFAAAGYSTVPDHHAGVVGLLGIEPSASNFKSTDGQYQCHRDAGSPLGHEFGPPSSGADALALGHFTCLHASLSDGAGAALFAHPKGFSACERR